MEPIIGLDVAATGSTAAVFRAPDALPVGRLEVPQRELLELAGTRWLWLLGRPPREARRMAVAAGLDLLPGGLVLGEQTVPLAALVQASVAAALGKVPGARGFTLAVPSAFDQGHREVLLAACRDAGWAVDRMLCATTAAALVVARRDGLTAVVDVGASHLEVALLDMDGEVVDVVVRHADTTLGAEVIETAVTEYLLDELSRSLGGSVRKEPGLVPSVRREARAALVAQGIQGRELRILAPPALRPRLQRPGVVVPRDLWRHGAEALLQRVESACRVALDEAERPAQDVTRVVLVGGVADAPELRARMEAFFGRLPECPGAGAVARGAALLDASLRGQHLRWMLHEPVPEDAPRAPSEPPGRASQFGLPAVGATPRPSQTTLQTVPSASGLHLGPPVRPSQVAMAAVGAAPPIPPARPSQVGMPAVHASMPLPPARPSQVALAAVSAAPQAAPAPPSQPATPEAVVPQAQDPAQDPEAPQEAEEAPLVESALASVPTVPSFADDLSRDDDFEPPARPSQVPPRPSQAPPRPSQAPPPTVDAAPETAPETPLPEASPEVPAAEPSEPERPLTPVMLTSPERAPVPAPNPAPLSSRLAPMQHASRASSAPPRALHDNVAPPHRPVVVAASGPFRGVLKLTDVVAMPLVRTPTPEELQKPYLPVALLGLANNRDRTGYVKLEQRGETVPLPVYHGHPVLTSQEKTFVLRAFSWAEGTFTFQPAPEVSPSSTRTREPMLALVLAGLRPLLRTFGVGELTLALGELIGRAPLVPKDRMARVDRLALSSQELRVLERDFVGKVALREMLSANPVFRGTLATLSFTLQVFGCLEWCEPEVTLGISPEKELERRRLAMLRGNHFDVLGVHWSASPAALKDAREKLGKEYGPGSKWAKLNPGVCRELLQKVEAAYALLKDEDKRVAYRRTAYPDVDPELLDGLLESQMKALEWRGATEEAQDTRQIRHELRASVAGRPPTQRS